MCLLRLSWVLIPSRDTEDLSRKFSRIINRMHLGQTLSIGLPQAALSFKKVVEWNGARLGQQRLGNSSPSFL